MAATANAGGAKLPPHLRVIAGRGKRLDGQDTDSGGRPVSPSPEFYRGAPRRPDQLSDDAGWLWDQVVNLMATVGILKPLDAAALEAACENFARWREAVRFRREHGILAKNSQGTVAAPWIGIEERASREFRAWCAEFGITPAAERNLRQESLGDAEDNPFG